VDGAHPCPHLFHVGEVAVETALRERPACSGLDPPADYVRLLYGGIHVVDRKRHLAEPRGGRLVLVRNRLVE
jgi:hypothetical protein